MEKTTIKPFLSGYLSQWYSSSFVIDDIKYSTAEHYMMAEKARLFGDDQALEAILNAKTPKEAKSWGRKVKNFDQTTWNQNARDIVFKGNLAKFEQNPSLKRDLLATQDSILVEGNLFDNIWGVGLGVVDARISNPSKWKGTNWLGQVLMGVRVKLGGKEPNRGKYLKYEATGSYDPDDTVF